MKDYYNVIPYGNHYIVINETTNEIKCHVETLNEGRDEIKNIVLSKQ